jgi:prepilin-type N-terminal cleavage/methylation domain-containing protein
VSPLARIRRRLRDERGFTLVELLMATVVGVGVLLAAYTLSTALLHAQTRISDRTEAIARGRTAMEQITQQLRSQVCLGAGLPAIAYGDSNHITFYADLANTTFVPQKRDLQFASGALTERDYSGTATTGTPPFTFSATPVRTRVIADRLLNQQSGGTTVPFFTYYSFDAGNPVRPANLLPTPLSASDAARVVQIRVAFAALPTRGGATYKPTGEPFTANVYNRTADPTDPDHSPLCI